MPGRVPHCEFCSGPHQWFDCPDKARHQAARREGHEYQRAAAAANTARREDRHRIIEKPEPREREEPIPTTRTRFDGLSEAERARVPWQQPEGVCPSCDKRRFFNARRMARHREREG
jgi:hypothetical protein